MKTPPDLVTELLAGLRVADRSISKLLDELADARGDVADQREMIIRLQEQLQVTRDTLRTMEQIVRGDAGASGLTQQVLDLQRAEISLREAIKDLSDSSSAQTTAIIQTRGHQAQAIATVIAALLGAVSGIISLIITMRH